MSTRASERLEEPKQDLLRRAAQASGRTLGGRREDPERTLAFLRLYYRHVAAEELLGRDPMDVYGAAMAHHHLGGRRQAGHPRIRAYTPTVDEHGWESGHTVVDIVTDDMPFLVDSVSMELNRHQLGIHLVVHPQLRVRRDAGGRLLDVGRIAEGDRPPTDDGGVVVDESWMHVEVDRQLQVSTLRALEADLRRVLEDVRRAVGDWTEMRASALRTASELVEAPPPLPEREIAEGVELLRWLADDHFTFLGYQEYELVDDGAALRSVPGTGLGILRSGKEDRPADSAGFGRLSAEARALAQEPTLLVLTKANSRSTVHRPAYLDYIGVKIFGASGAVVGERRFLGLFTHVAYNESIARIPVLRRKLTEVLDRAGLAPDSHDGKDIIEILETYPRDELFQISTEELLPIALGVLRIRERRQLKLFCRTDPYGRFVSCLVYLPRDRYTTQVRLRIQDILREAFDAESIDYSAMVSESVLARLHVVARLAPGATLPEVDVEQLERTLAAATRSWGDDLADAIVEQCGEEHAAELNRRYGSAFPEAYKEDFPARTAVADMRRLESLASAEDPGLAIGLNLYEPYGAAPGERRFKIYRLGSPLSLSTVLPLLQCLGVEVVDERPYEIVRGGAEPAWIYDFGLRYQPAGTETGGRTGTGTEIDSGTGTADTDDRGAASEAKALVQEAFAAAWRGEVENDRFNALVLRAGLSVRQAMVLRAYCKYLRQTGSTFSQDYIEQVLLNNVRITKLLVRLFEARLDPRYDPRFDPRQPREGDTGGGVRARRRETADAIVEEVEGELDEVASLDEDRILRGYLGLITATLRTNYFQRGADGHPKPYLSLKFDSRAVPELPEPRPAYEIFVYSPRVEGVHLRFGPVARGGIRWSDRREDFRTEVLGLAKAQMVKNAVIVPVGAKGGFVVKRPPGDDRDALHREGIACYRQLISGMLDITDNLVGGEVVPPPDVVRHDGDDTYLVVAADKGTATFSDIANEIAGEYGFWLNDAFASGGSAGYDHKAMGITARGAWESVRRHFRELDIDVERHPITVVGIGDMSGDVFGNGMLLSRNLRLVAAFDHRHIFLDPNPDPEAGYRERERLFRMRRSSWGDYDRAVISAGGGVHPRTAKSIPITPQVRTALGLAEAPSAMTPHELIRAVLRAPVDLLWNGGIGTYVKAESESHADVGDKANDAVRVDGSTLRCRVVGEGGNLGLTQLGRIEYALAGGRINTDFIDNSAGVDTSDHEVNIKILLDGVVRDGDLTTKQRTELLSGMEREIARLVLRNNYQQNVALTAARAQAAGMLHVHARYIDRLERDGLLDRNLEFLPNEKAIVERRQAGLGLTSPEFSVLLAYTKNVLAVELLGSDLPDDPYLHGTLASYFPEALRERFGDRLWRHPLRREIVTTCVVDDMVDHGGTTFAFRMREETGTSAADLTRAYLVARDVFAMPTFWRAVEECDGTVDVATQTAMLLEGRKLTERATRWLLTYRRAPLDIEATIEEFAGGVAAIVPQLSRLLAGADLKSYAERRDSFVTRGVPKELAERVAGMVPAYSTFDLVEIAHDSGRPVEEVAEVYFDLADRLQITRLRERIIALPRDDRWRTMARAALRDDLYAAHAQLTRDVLVTSEPGAPPEERLAAWAERNAAAVARASETLGEIWESDTFDIATLSVALRVIRTLVNAARL